MRRLHQDESYYFWGKSGVEDDRSLTTPTKSSRRFAMYTDGNTTTTWRKPFLIDDDNNNNNHSNSSILLKKTTTTRKTITCKSVYRFTNITICLWWLWLCLWCCGGCSMVIFVIVVEAASSSLLGGRYQTTTDVTNYLNLALDAANMKETDDFDTKKNIYENVREGREEKGM
jgi:hypothetical protein